MKTATLTLNFEDGTHKDIILSKAIELRIGEERKQSLEFRETKNGEWVMAYTSPLLEGKSLKNVNMEKNP